MAMGVKTIKDHYRIEHIVQRVGDTICIGSPYIHNLIVISSEGKLLKVDNGYHNADLNRYAEELRADEKSGELKAWFHVRDTFGPLIYVYTIDNGRVIRKECEEFGWPNTTTDGMIMYENSHFLTYDEALKDLLNDTRLHVKYTAESFSEAVRDAIRTIGRRTGRLLTAIWYYILARVTR